MTGVQRALWRVLIPLGLVVTLWAMFTATTTATASPISSTFSSPVYAGDFPDPSVLLIQGTYWAYATGSVGRNLQVMSSTDLHSWTTPVDPLPTLPRWASPGKTWAPGVLLHAGTFIMYYTVHDSSRGVQCISVATSTTPNGPFRDTSRAPLICQTKKGGSIDPNPYLDPSTGKLYLLWKSDENSLGPGHLTRLWGQRLSADGLSLGPGKPSLLLTESAPWQNPVIEGPAMIWHAGTYFLFYGANNFDTASSAIGYATASSPLAAFTNQSVSGPWLGTTGSAQGPQGPALFTDTTGATRMAFAAWYGAVGYENGGVRSLWIGTFGFNSAGTPTLN
jgi:beta-xylosidase